MNHATIAWFSLTQRKLRKNAKLFDLSAFCCKQTSPLDVPIYAFGFRLLVLHNFPVVWDLPNPHGYFKKSLDNYYDLGYNIIRSRNLGVAQFGSVLEWGSRGREFDSPHSDHKKAFASFCKCFFIELNNICGCDGIGRRARFRFLCLSAWGFKSLHPHQNQRQALWLVFDFALCLIGT